MSKSTLLLCVACSALAVSQVTAQTPAPMRQVDSVQQRQQMVQSAASAETGELAPELYPDESSDVGPQSVLKYKPRRSWIEAFADEQYFYTDNVFLSDDDKQGADVLVSTVQLALAPTPFDLGGGQLAPRIGYRHQWFNFGLISDDEVVVFDVNSTPPGFRTIELNELDFNVQTPFADVRWTCGNWVVGAGLDYTRLLDSDYESFYREYVPRWGVQRLFPVCEKSVLSLGYEGDYRFTDSDLPPFGLGQDFNDRTDHSFVLAFNQTLCDHALVQPFYRFKYTRFTAGEDRNDYLNSFGVGIYCFITPQITLRGFVGYDILESSSGAVLDYKKLDAGGGLNLTIRF